MCSTLSPVSTILCVEYCCVNNEYCPSAAAVFGYLNFRDEVCGNILLNYDSNSSKLHLVTFGRIGLFLTLLCSYPLLIHPCRDNVERLAIMLMNQRRKARSESSLIDDIKADEPFDDDDDDGTEIVKSAEEGHKFSSGRRVMHSAAILVTACLSALFVPGVQVSGM